MSKPSSSPPKRLCVPCRLAAIGAVVAALAGGFAYTAGWLTPARLTTARIVNQLQANAGVYPGYRRNHAKGVCVSGYFVSNGDGAEVSRAGLFDPGVITPVIGRFAIPGGNPYAPDASVPIRSMALLFQLKDGEQWRTGMNSVPLFPVRTPLKFFEQLVASRPDPATGKPDPARLKAFFAANPETQPFLAWLKANPPSSSFANAAYYSVNAFRFTNADGQTRAVRWATQPEAPYAPLTAAQKEDKNFLGGELEQRLKEGALRWDLILTVAAPGDPTNDATQQWPADRQQIDAGTLVIDHESSQAEGLCRDVNFDPTILPAGIRPSDDPLLAARSAAYALSFNRRTHEEAQQPDLPSHPAAQPSQPDQPSNGAHS
ncbi:catalase family peroxidase [Trinickia terrae]|uniref:catalase family peroxidase n=1 Tax=Trinickia terrae TaxID=2571161 RepID=UPI001F1000FB|nr:catalase family peroxidase [Trinickia terrae]